MKWFVALAFLGIIASLGSALFFMMRRPDSEDEGGQPANPAERDARNRARSQAMVRALALRVGVSIALFLCILLMWKLGYIQPTGLPVTPV